MQAKLARVFVQRGIIRQGSIIEAYQSAKGLSGICDSHKLMTYAVLGAKATDSVVTFETIGSDKQRYRVPCEFVQTLDGMDIGRVAESHRLTDDGDEIPKKRRV
jgi:hypothetical protein